MRFSSADWSTVGLSRKRSSMEVESSPPEHLLPHDEGRDAEQPTSDRCIRVEAQPRLDVGSRQRVIRGGNAETRAKVLPVLFPFDGTPVTPDETEDLANGIQLAA